MQSSAGADPPDRRTPLRWPGRLPVAAVLAVALAAAAAGAPVGRVLVVEDADTGDRLLAAPVEDGASVTVAYTHSVERTPVRDVYAVDGRRLVMTRMRFQSYGWGLPAEADVEMVDGWFVTRPDWTGRELYVTPGRVADHRLVVGDRTYDLVALADAETVRIRVARRSLLDRLLAGLDRGRGPPAAAVDRDRSQPGEGPPTVDRDRLPTVGGDRLQPRGGHDGIR